MELSESQPIVYAWVVPGVTPDVEMATRGAVDKLSSGLHSENVETVVY